MNCCARFWEGLLLFLFIHEKKQDIRREQRVSVSFQTITTIQIQIVSDFARQLVWMAV